VAKGSDAVKCPVCASGAERFLTIDAATAEAMVAQEGGSESEETFDGVKLRWTLEAKEELRRIPVAYMRRRAKARIEKTARVRRLSAITRDFVLPIVQDSIVEGEAIGAAPTVAPKVAQNGQEPSRPAEGAQPTGQVIQLGTLSWSEEAIARLNRVPEGFMRDLTRQKIEDYARQNDVCLVTLEVAEKGIEVGRQMMAEMIAGYSQAKQEGANSGRQATSTAAGQATALNEIPHV
jgi:hypothetical protein